MKLLIEFTTEEFQHMMDKGVIANMINAGVEVEDRRVSEDIQKTLKKEVTEAPPKGFIPADDCPFDADEPEAKDEVTMEIVRAELNRANKAGKSAEIKKLFKKYGAAQFPEISPSDYAAVLAEAKKL